MLDEYTAAVSKLGTTGIRYATAPEGRKVKWGATSQVFQQSGVPVAHRLMPAQELRARVFEHIEDILKARSSTVVRVRHFTVIELRAVIAHAYHLCAATVVHAFDIAVVVLIHDNDPVETRKVILANAPGDTVKGEATASSRRTHTAVRWSAFVITDGARGIDLKITFAAGFANQVTKDTFSRR